MPVFRAASLLVLVLISSTFAEDSKFKTSDFEYFEKHIRPLLSRRCYSCHSADAKTVQGGLRLDSSSALTKGGDSGAAILPGAPQQSLLIQTLHYEGDIQMPPKGKLPDVEIALLTEWVKHGAPFPADTDAPVRADGEIDFEAGRQFWSFQPVSEHTPPAVRDTSWPRRRIDHFLLAKMEQNNLQPSAAADRKTLLRRLSFNLTGLPPTPAELDEFVNDDSNQAYAKQVERLLQSPHFGERWGRLWLDFARYTDTTASWLYSTGQAHLYRDWVVQAFNDDMPYDDFVRRQLATDLMPGTGADDIAALGFLGLSPNYWKELKLPAEIIKVIVADEWEERVDVVSRTFLGLTVACARCHDHKFDPVSTEDYYALAGVFASCRISERPTIDERLFEPVKAARADVAKLEKELAALRKKKPVPEEQVKETLGKISKLKSATPNYDTPMASALIEESLFVERAGTRADEGTRLDYRSEPRDLNVFIRGNPNRLGKVVPRRFLQVLSPSDPPRFTDGSGRLELAESIVGPAAPLTARVIVNRMWAAHFGQGLVATPSNFGQLGEQPTHPKLLDDLAARFIANGWSLKTLHREIVMSAAYRQASSSLPSSDPENKFLARMNRRRLDVEPWRDAILQVSGQLDLTAGGSSVALDDPNNVRRTIYSTIHRREMSTMLLTHDFPDPTSHSPQRVSTTTSLQGLYALNGPLLEKQASALAARLAARFPENDGNRIALAYSLLYCRQPTPAELDLGLQYLGACEKEQRAAVWQQYAHVLLVANEFLFVD
ncbi:MAG: PSD1 and planctomycete cytochrome C domain-containing protein [Fuerstiella sp.]|nr:PSD1 and planctomycete cytochrome C domain-containing protein [Fuerstiella sp.]